jgi:hypothetical protein
MQKELKLYDVVIDWIQTLPRIVQYFIIGWAMILTMLVAVLSFVFLVFLAMHSIGGVWLLIFVVLSVLALGFGFLFTETFD